MSLMGMRRAVKRYGTPIWITLAGAMVVTSLVGFGSYWFGDEIHNRAQNGAEDPPVAVVGTLKVRRSDLDRTSFDRSPLGRASMGLMGIEQVKQQAAAEAAARQAGITVTDADIEAIAAERWKAAR